MKGIWSGYSKLGFALHPLSIRQRAIRLRNIMAKRTEEYKMILLNDVFRPGFHCALGTGWPKTWKTQGI